jgi:hypothetical protein
MYKIKDEVSVCAYHIGKYEEAAKMYTELLLVKNLPGDHADRIKMNLEFALKMMVKY